ncbi:MAG TPA: hypothetical protein VFQ07_12725 [Candidatus Polarisedimenticolia bacterium]|nr:hypothetical protein [Candidatus Polarisedimenticolia bacterium]
MLRLGFRRSGSAPARRAEGPAAPAGTGRPRFAIRLAAVVLGLLGALALLEIGLRVLTAFDLIHLPQPLGSDDAFWDGRNPLFGVWHRPGMSATHRSHCFNVRYKTNSLGARDVEHAPRETIPRVLALGDSYLEGWGVEQERRLTDLLQKSSGLEFMNLAMSHFGPYQELLAYREFAPRFEHHAVLIGVLPMNDFYDLDLAIARHSPGYMYRYRPYLSGSFPDYHRTDLQESDARRFLRRESAAFNALAWMWYALSREREGFDHPPPFATPTGTVHSFYYDYSRKEYLLLRYCLTQLATAAQGRPVIVVLLPAPPDFLRYVQAGPPPLTKDLEAQGLKDGFRVIDLLPEMAARTKDPSDYFFSCDFHWNEVGHAVAADILGTRLRASFLPFPPVDREQDAIRAATAPASHSPR